MLRNITRFVSRRYFATGSGKHDPKDHARIHSIGSQVEAEWKRPELGAHFVNDAEGYEVPDCFSEHRHKFENKPANLEAYRK